MWGLVSTHGLYAARKWLCGILAHFRQVAILTLPNCRNGRSLFKFNVGSEIWKVIGSEIPVDSTMNENLNQGNNQGRVRCWSHWLLAYCYDLECYNTRQGLGPIALRYPLGRENQRVCLRWIWRPLCGKSSKILSL